MPSKRKNSSFWRFIGYDRRQLEVNRRYRFESYSGTVFHAQQFAEKIMKQKLKLAGAENIRTHNLCALVAALCDYCIDPREKDLSEVEDACRTLSAGYISCRYPVPGADPMVLDEKTARYAMQCASVITAWVGTLIIPDMVSDLPVLAYY